MRRTYRRLGPLGPAVLQRSLNQLKSKLESPTFRVQGYPSQRSLMFLATRWDDGLRLLLNAGFSPVFCMEEALREDGLEALKIALEFPGWDPLRGLFWAVLSSDAVQQYLVDTILQRRNGVLHLCYQHLTGPELAELGLPGQTPIDAKVAQALDMLTTKGLLKDLDNRYMILGESPVYTTFSSMLRHAQHERVSSLLEKLYAAGFRDIDGQRVFARRSWDVLGLDSHGDDSTWTVLQWLAEKAVLPLRSLITHWPSAIFDIVLVYCWDFITERQLSRASDGRTQSSNGPLRCYAARPLRMLLLSRRLPAVSSVPRTWTGRTVP
ncbi:hypothetical protein GE09DRAFT_693295 [Coniochaeta sp. 2T2.1]|nr:hypothetical protein GE09DRAFT_693295 [Coniochaeta sp. 2T2.1]